MANPEIKTLPIAVRIFPDPPVSEGDNHPAKVWREPEGVLVIHIPWAAKGREKLVGSYRFIVGGECVEEGLFYDHLPKNDVRVLKNYVAHHLPQLQLLTRREFLQLFYELGYKSRCLIVGFNLPRILSRLAFDSARARGFFFGGFSHGLWTYTDEKGRERPNGFRPRICIKHIDQKRALIAFTARNSPDKEDLIPEGSTSGNECRRASRRRKRRNPI